MKKSVSDLKAMLAEKPKPKEVLAAKKPVSVVARTSTKKASVIGRPKVAEAEKRTEKVTLSLTKAEAESLRKKAGMVPQAAFILSKLHENGMFE